MSHTNPTDSVAGNILLVDDNGLNRVLTAAVLTKAKFDVDTAEDGDAALDALLAKHYDLVLLDLDMPGLDGFGVASAMKKRECASGGTWTMPVTVALSALPDVQSERQSHSVGIVRHIQRPIRPDELLRQVNEIMSELPNVDRSARTWDKAAFTDFEARLGRQRMRDVLTSLLARCGELRTALGGIPASKEAVARHAHDIASIGGMLGFGELSATCVDLQNYHHEAAYSTGMSSLPGALDRSVLALREHLASG